ncbi:helix-turn-helix transcriptional regulator [Paenibacillus hexagrammi]|uniref:AraC family transcriptional regulator n=1 Tax=Paenibacillus hexagrammi TaxID=2908839 RepID=A0ABY3SRX6_9BACL|nr:helix-turn-helix domain-containing protein [Paenibacillus sp. YPD9-1]UJF35727.1 AraC family transcriptional regulator [Paenibacillus sp. YPD9-1]
MLLDMGGNSHTNTYLTTLNGELISSRMVAASQYEPLIASAAKMANQDGDHYYVDSTRKVPSLITYSKPMDNGWLLISETPMNYLIHKLSFIRNVTVTVCLLLIVIGAVISYFLSRSIYLPFKRLLHLNTSLESSFRASLPAMQERFVDHLLNNKIGSSSEIQSQIDFFQSRLTPLGYVVMLIEIDNYPLLVNSYSSMDLNLYKFAIGNIAEEIVGEPFNCLSTEGKANQRALLINVRETTQSELTIILKEIATRVSATIYSMLKFTVTIGIGNRYEHIEDAYMSYNEALDSIQHKLVLGANQILFYQDIAQDRSGIDYYYPFQLEKHMMNLLKKGDTEGALACLDSLTQEVKEKRDLSHANIFRIYTRLLDAALEALTELNGTIGKAFGEDVLLYRELAGRETVDAIHEWFGSTIITRIAAYAAVKEQSNPLVDKAVQHLQQHFRTDLSVEEVAEAVGINPAYLSRLFKQQVGKTIVEYLTNLRLEESKQLLSESSLNIHEIARSIGYNNTNSYIRFFKKYEGITPGDYRKQNSTGG